MRSIRFVLGKRLLRGLARITRFANRKLAVLVLILSTVLALLGLVTPYLIKVFIDQVLIPRSLTLLYIIIGLFVTVELAETAVGYAFTYYQRKFEETVKLNVAKALLLHLEGLDLEFHKQAKVGDLLARFGNDVQGVQDLIETVSITFKDLVLGIGAFIIIFTINPQVALFSLIVFPLYAIVTYRYKRKTRTRSKALRRITGELTSFLQERLSSIKTIKIFQREKEESEAYVTKSQGFIKQTLQYTVFSRGVGALLHYIGYLPTLFVLGFGGYQALIGALTIGGLMATYTYTRHLLGPFSTYGQFGLQLEENLSAVDRLFEIFEQQPKIADKEGALELKHVRGEITLDRVFFQYTEAENVLVNVSFKVRSGQSVALVGPSGAGKSTIADLMCRFYDPTAGTISLDGYDLRAIKTSSLRENISIVTQRPSLYNLSVKENIRYGRLTATDEEIAEAAKHAEIHDFVISLPQGYNTIIGERGVRLSEGQQQRISLARMFLKNPSILVLDEATSSLDAESEKRIHRAVGKVFFGKTVFIIAHRLSTISDVDEILVLKNHQITEHGPFQELMMRKGDFYELFRQQVEAVGSDRKGTKDYIEQQYLP